jgi:hypothetical protein
VAQHLANRFNVVMFFFLQHNLQPTVRIKLDYGISLRV